VRLSVYLETAKLRLRRTCRNHNQLYEAGILNLPDAISQIHNLLSSVKFYDLHTKRREHHNDARGLIERDERFKRLNATMAPLSKHRRAKMKPV
jgi:hypothetical protein